MASLVLGVLFVSACDGEKAPDAATDAVADMSPEQESEQARQKRLRAEAFGLPLPPRVVDIVREDQHIFVKTDMRIKELEAFYKKHLVDYEILIVGSTLRAIPLRDGMPWVRVSRPFGPRHPLHVTYIHADAVAPPPLQSANGEPLEGEALREELERRRKPLPKERVPKKGEPVMLRTPSGELLAPGAKWGEPYTPPPGSPLDKPRNRYNFGQPFGEWRAD